MRDHAMTVEAVENASASAGAQAALRRIAFVAVAAVILGLAVQAVVLALLLAGGGDPGAQALVGLAQGVTWSVLVCAGVSVATTIAKARSLLAGLISFLVAPLALGLARASQKAMTGWLGAAQSDAVLSLGTISVLRAVEYGLLGWLLGRLVLRNAARPWPFLGAGALVGVLFGGAISFLTWQVAVGAGTPLPLPKLLATVVNEVVFPIGCALVIHLGQSVGRSLRLAGAAGA